VATLVAAVILVAVVVLTSGSDVARKPAAIAVATTTTAAPTPSATKAPSAVRSISGDGFSYEIPAAAGWSLSPEEKGSLTIRELSGPGGELIRIVHSPGVRAEPVVSTIVSEDAFEVPSVPDARKFVLKNFPSEGCRDRRCDDYVLNDDAFGGLAILAGDSAGPASRMAARIARSVTAG
jgi:hypothetical protein